MSENIQDRYRTLHELIAQARTSLSKSSWNYLIGGTETETTVRRNRHAIESVGLRPRVLNDVSSVDATTQLFGKAARLPVMLAPVGGLEAFHDDGALAVARAAGAFNVPLVLSSVSPKSMEEIRASTAGAAVFQLYVRGDANWVDDQVEQAVAAGFDAFCFTVDSAVYSRRERDIAGRFKKPWRAYVDDQAIHYQAALSWDTIARTKAKFDIPVLLKGIACAEDAALAAEHGVDGLIVSNHGGRQLDHGVGSLSALPAICDAVGDTMPVYVDGGFCRGTDVVKALALGATGVGIGRLYCYALAAAGPDGVVRMLEILETEINSALGLLGITRLQDLNSNHVVTSLPVVSDLDVLSAFPLLDSPT